jgi:hypothetical protein
MLRAREPVGAVEHTPQRQHRQRRAAIALQLEGAHTAAPQRAWEACQTGDNKAAPAIRRADNHTKAG